MSLINHVSGDLTTLSGHFIIIQQVNCQDRMGAGLAKSLMTRWPQVATDYHAYCAGKRDVDLLGHVQTTTVGDDQFVCNVFGQRYYGRSGHYTNEAKLLGGIAHILDHAGRAGLPVYIPANIGSGLAGGDRDSIQGGIARLAEQYNCPVNLVDFSRNSL